MQKTLAGDSFQTGYTPANCGNALPGCQNSIDEVKFFSVFRLPSEQTVTLIIVVPAIE